MKKTMLVGVLLLTVAGLFLATGCSSDGPRTQVIYVCPMHTNITGMEGAKCSACGMPLERKEVRAPTESREGASPSPSSGGHGGHGGH